MLPSRFRRARAAVAVVFCAACVSLPGLALFHLIAPRTAIAGSPTDDGVPSGTMAFFNVTSGSCPSGWAPALETAGRLVVGTETGSVAGTQVGTPLGDSEDRTHTHDYAGMVTFAPKTIFASGGSDNQGAASGMDPVKGTTDPATSGLPFIQLLACEKQ